MSTPTSPRSRRQIASLASPSSLARFARKTFLVLAAAAAVIQPVWHPASAQDSGRTGRPNVKINPDGYTSARTCGHCHVDIYNSWKNSLHAFSLSDPIFDTAYMQALKEVGQDAGKICLGCHAPMTLFNGDYDLKEGVTREGVSCDFCHTVTAVHLNDHDAPFSADPGLVKRGIIKEAGSPTHEVAYSDLHGTSEFCGGCHNYVAANGTPIMTTYDEWREGPYAREGVQCQNCHMVLGEGKIVTEEVKRIASSEFHVHSLIHDTDQLRNALGLEIVQARRRGRDLDVEIVLTNEGSGHMVPTGMPTREVVLTVTAEFDDQSRTEERRYRRTLLDEKGRSLLTDVENLLYGAHVASDNRIAPRERRTERFRFTVPASGSVKVSATASYVYSPPVLDKISLNVKLASAEEYAQ